MVEQYPRKRDPRLAALAGFGENALSYLLGGERNQLAGIETQVDGDDKVPVGRIDADGRYKRRAPARLRYIRQPCAEACGARAGRSEA